MLLTSAPPHSPATWILGCNPQPQAQTKNGSVHSNSTATVCSVDGPLDPVDVIGDVGVDAGQVLPRAPDAPRDEADEDVATAHRGHQGAAAVALERFADVRLVDG